MTTLTIMKPQGTALTHSFSGRCYHWEIGKVSSPNSEGLMEVTVDVEIYNGIDLVKEAINVFFHIKDHFDDRLIFQKILDQMLGLMSSEQKEEYSTKSHMASHPFWRE